jgi:mono/diheme cytochrome c family protein
LAVTIPVMVAVMFEFAGAAKGAVLAPFIKDQVDAGHDSYASNCSQCHNEDLPGRNAPAFAGNPFIISWSKHTTSELYVFIQHAMPLCDGSVSLTTTI